MIEFKPLTFDDMPLMHHWFNLPHVQKYYSLRDWTQDEVTQKLYPYITNQKPVSGFVIFIYHYVMMKKEMYFIKKLRS